MNGLMTALPFLQRQINVSLTTNLNYVGRLKCRLTTIAIKHNKF